MPASPAFTFTGASGSLAKLSATPESVITATLDDLSGVQSVTWSIFSTDETGTQHTITTSGVKGSVATLTAGLANTAGILQCTVSDGTRTYSASAKWYVGIEVGCLNETNQGDPVWYTVPIINNAVRNGGSGVSSSRAIIAGNGLFGGGDLTADVTIAIMASDGSITVNADSIGVGALQTDAQHGVRGGGSQHSLVVSGGAAGFMSGTDKQALDTLVSGSVANTRTITAGAGLTGGGNLSADRTINVVAADGSIVVNADSIQLGVIQSDAQHGVRGGGTQHAVAVSGGAAGFMSGADKLALDNLVTTSVPNTRTITAGAGLSGGGTLASDRTIDIVAADGSISVSPNSIAVGVLQTDVQHGSLGGGSTHAAATTSVAGFMSAADKAKLDAATTSATASTLALRGSAGELRGSKLQATAGGTAVSAVGDLGMAIDGRPTAWVGSVRSIALVDDPRWTITSIKTSNYSAAIDELVRINASTALTVTLPSAIANTGRMVAVKEVNGSEEAITVNTILAQTINGASTDTWSGRLSSRYYVSDGSNWIRLSVDSGSTAISSVRTSGHVFLSEILPVITTTDATATTIKSIALPIVSSLRVMVEIHCRSQTTEDVAEFEARNSFRRTSAGVSSRLGPAGGTQTSVANTFGAPRPAVNFGDPAATNVATVVITGKTGHTINWYIELKYSESA